LSWLRGWHRRMPGPRTARTLSRRRTSTKSNRFAGSRRFDFDPSIRAAEQRLDFVFFYKKSGEVLRRDKVLRSALRRTKSWRCGVFFYKKSDSTLIHPSAKRSSGPPGHREADVQAEDTATRTSFFIKKAEKSRHSTMSSAQPGQSPPHRVAEDKVLAVRCTAKRTSFFWQKKQCGVKKRRSEQKRKTTPALVRVHVRVHVHEVVWCGVVRTFAGLRPSVCVRLDFSAFFIKFIKKDVRVAVSSAWTSASRCPGGPLLRFADGWIKVESSGLCPVRRDEVQPLRGWMVSFFIKYKKSGSTLFL
jgi:hypothetical protein